MIPISDFKETAEARLADAQALLGAGRYDAAVYMSGYAVEVALKARMCDTKARMCDTLGWELPRVAKGFLGSSPASHPRPRRTATAFRCGGTR